MTKQLCNIFSAKQFPYESFLFCCSTRFPIRINCIKYNFLTRTHTKTCKMHDVVCTHEREEEKKDKNNDDEITVKTSVDGMRQSRILIYIRPFSLCMLLVCAAFFWFCKTVYILWQHQWIWNLMDKIANANGLPMWWNWPFQCTQSVYTSVHIGCNFVDWFNSYANKCSWMEYNQFFFLHEKLTARR